MTGNVAASEGRVRQDIAFQFGALTVMGAAGIVLNLIIGAIWGAAALGVFNQVFAVYVFFSQIAAAGIHNGTLKFTAERADDARERSAVALASLFLGLGFSAFGTTIFVAAAGLVSELLESPQVGEGMYWAAAGLFLFSINKILLAHLNGRMMLRAYAVLLGLRYAGIVVGAAIMAVMAVDAAMLPGVFSLGEAFVVLLALPAALKNNAWPGGRALREWAGRLAPFGVKSAPAGVLWGLNTRIDVLCLGYFLSDTVVGVYSFAAMFAEGMHQLPLALRAVFSPRFVERVARGDMDGLRVMARRVRNRVWGAMALVGATAVVLYPQVLEIASYFMVFGESWPLFAILTLGVVAAAGYTPFNNALVLVGCPGMHSIYVFAIVVVNVIGNLLLIPYWQATGAAAATAFAIAVSAFMLVWLLRQRAGIRI